MYEKEHSDSIDAMRDHGYMYPRYAKWREWGGVDAGEMLWRHGGCSDVLYESDCRDEGRVKMLLGFPPTRRKVRCHSNWPIQSRNLHSLHVSLNKKNPGDSLNQHIPPKHQQSEFVTPSPPSNAKPPPQIPRIQTTTSPLPAQQYHHSPPTASHPGHSTNKTTGFG